MKLNLRRPTLVITGLWNPAIFQPAWVAVTLLNVPSGAEINFVEVIEAPGKVTHYFGDIGICVPPGRLELFVNVRADEKWTELENLALKILATLPHTPIQGFGINFRFEDDNPDPAVVDKLWTHEGLETRFEIVASSMRNRLKFEDCELLLVREISDGSFSVDFNFHHAEMSLDKLTEILPGAIVNRLNRATVLMLDVYNIEIEQPVLAHQFPATAAE